MRQSVVLRVVLVCERLLVQISVSLMLSDVVLKMLADGLFESFDLSTGLHVVGHRRRTFNA